MNLNTAIRSRISRHSLIQQGYNSLVLLALGTKVVRGTKMFLLNISAQISYPPSIHRLLVVMN